MAHTYGDKLRAKYPMPDCTYTWSAQDICDDLDSGDPNRIAWRMSHETIARWEAEKAMWEARARLRQASQGREFAQNCVIVLETIIARLVQAKLEGY